MSNHHVIEQILASADIVKIIGKHVELKRSGNEFKGCCPFHGEKTPSFFVNPQKNLYNCFGCGVKGNALTFLKEYENLTAGEALRELSRQTGIELPKEPYKKEVMYQRAAPQRSQPQPPRPPIAPLPNFAPTFSPIQSPVTDDANVDFVTGFDTVNPSTDDPWQPVAGEPAWVDWDSVGSFQSVEPFFDLPLELAEQENGLTSLYDLLEQITLFYQIQLANSEFAKQYFIKRGLTEQTIAEFSLGYAPTGWQHLEEAFPRDIEGLKILGLVRTSQKGNDFDLLRHRVIFPIRDNQGRVVGFAGRSLNDEDMPKYINSSDSPVFKKQHILYGLYEGRKAKAKDWLVVEGYMDVISLHQAGVYGAVASMGTAIATSQIEKLLQLNPVLTLSFDGDSAGQTAAWRAMEVGLPALTDGKELRFLTLPNNHDPDSFVKAHGAAAMREQIRQAVPLSQYLYTSLTRQYQTNSAEHRSKILQELYQLTQKLPKGSYGWLLREDIKSRMGLGRKQQAQQAQDALVSFTTQLTLTLQLQLCFLYQPELLGSLYREHLNEQFITEIYETSRAFCAFMPSKKTTRRQKSEDIAAHRAFSSLTFECAQDNKASWQGLRMDDGQNLLIAYRVLAKFYAHQFLRWQDIVDSDTLTLIGWVQRIQPQLIKFDEKSLGEYERINAKAHFILAGLPSELQQRLVEHWVTFFNSLSQRLVTDVSMLIGEIVIKLMIERLNKQKESLRGDLYHMNQCIKHQAAIVTWQRQWLQQQDDVA